MSTEKQARYTRIRFRIFMLIILPFLFISCAKNYKYDNCEYYYTLSIGNSLSINKADVESEFTPVLKQNMKSNILVEIVIFSYSSGKELFSYSEDTQGDVLTRIQTGKAEALVKIKLNNKLKKAFFVNSAGNTKKEILHKLAIASRDVLCGL